ncbi:hypothetical protein BC829DRAFT_395219, partial [Chytridium lagenaria]
MQKPNVTAPIIGAKNIEQLKQNLLCATFALTKEEMDTLDTVSASAKPYPFSMIDLMEGCMEGAEVL